MISQRRNSLYHLRTHNAHIFCTSFNVALTSARLSSQNAGAASPRKLYPGQKLETVCKDHRRISRLRTFPIASPRPPRLPLWEIFQRGPPEQQAQPPHHGPHRKIFTRAVIIIYRCMRSQHGNFSKCSIWRATARLQTRPFEHRAARFVGLSLSRANLFVRSNQENKFENTKYPQALTQSCNDRHRRFWALFDFGNDACLQRTHPLGVGPFGLAARRFSIF